MPDISVAEKINTARKDVSKKENPSRSTVGYLDVIWIALFTAFLTIAAYDRFFASKVVTVDLTGFVGSKKNSSPVARLERLILPTVWTSFGNSFNISQRT